MPAFGQNPLQTARHRSAWMGESLARIAVSCAAFAGQGRAIPNHAPIGVVAFGLLPLLSTFCACAEFGLMSRAAMPAAARPTKKASLEIMFPPEGGCGSRPSTVPGGLR